MWQREYHEGTTSLRPRQVHHGETEGNTTDDLPKQSEDRNTVEPMMVKNDRKATLQALHTDAVDKAVKSHEQNVVLDGRPPPISSSEKELTRKECSTLN